MSRKTPPDSGRAPLSVVEEMVAVARAGMQQVGPNTWAFPTPNVAPMKGHCRACNQSVAMLRPRELSLATGNYIVRGDCAECGQEVVLILS